MNASQRAETVFMLHPSYKVLTVVVLYPQNKIAAGVADGFHSHTGILLNWCLGKKLPCKTTGQSKR